MSVLVMLLLCLISRPAIIGFIFYDISIFIYSYRDGNKVGNRTFDRVIFGHITLVLDGANIVLLTATRMPATSTWQQVILIGYSLGP